MELTCPIHSIDLPGISDLELKGLIVIIGPNSSGKSQLLHDIDDVICGRQREFVVVAGVQFNEPPPLDDYIESLLELGSLRVDSKDQFAKRTLQLGADEGGGGTFQKSSLTGQHSKFLQLTKAKVSKYVATSAYLNEIGPMSCAVLFLKNRLSLMDSCGTFDYVKQGPSKTLQSLYLNKVAKNSLFSEISNVFHKAIWVDNTLHSKLVIRVIDSDTLPAAENRLDPIEMEQHRTIETEGDGLRSYAAICATLLIQQRPLCIVDEPEMCLHPPQAYSMGRFIGAHASTGNKCTIVASHSSHILKGILESNPNAHVVRLTRKKTTFGARLLKSDLLKEVTSKPKSRSEAVLEGLLSHGVVLCEAEGDRIVYESTYRTFKGSKLDIRFIPSEGTGGLPRVSLTPSLGGK